MSHAHRAPVHTHCQNCATPLTGPYCPNCGQRDVDFHRSFLHVVHEFIETWFHVDHSFLRGFFDLLFRPGVMTSDFNAGRRARYVPPFRFYLVISLLFFFVMLPRDVRIGKDVNINVSGAPTNGDVQSRAKPESTPAAARAEESEAERRTTAAVQEKLRHPDKLLTSYFHGLPKAMLVCLPMFAFLTWLMNRKGGYVYLQHLVLSVHLHTFVFLWTVVVTGWSGLIGFVLPSVSSWLVGAAWLYAAVYYFLALRRTLQLGKKRTILLGVAAGVIYVAFLTVVLVGSFTLALLA